MRISDWSSDVCSSDLRFIFHRQIGNHRTHDRLIDQQLLESGAAAHMMNRLRQRHAHDAKRSGRGAQPCMMHHVDDDADSPAFLPHKLRISAMIFDRSEEHTSELQSLMRISYAVFCLKKKTHKTQTKPRS